MRAAPRIAAWLALAVTIATAFHYAKKHEGDMLTHRPLALRGGYFPSARSTCALRRGLGISG
jgi:hypothetical protein